MATTNQRDGKIREEFVPFFSNVLIHVNGATFDINSTKNLFGTAEIGLDPSARGFLLSVIDGQHRINGAYFALILKREKDPKAKFEMPSEIFLDLDRAGSEPRRQAQIFIDVNLHQKKVDRSLVADLFPTTRGAGPLDRKDRAQDIGRKLMLEVGPLVGMIQIPGIKYGVKDVVTLATLNAGVEGIIPALDSCDISNLEAQVSFISQILDCWLLASGRVEAGGTVELDSQNVAYQGRILVSVLELIPAVLAHLKQRKIPFVSEKARYEIIELLRTAIDRAGMLVENKFIIKDKFKEMGFVGSGGISRFRNRIWAAFKDINLSSRSSDQIAEIAGEYRMDVNKALGIYGH